MHVVWWHQQHHTREKSYLPKLIGSLPKMCIFLYQQKYLTTFKYYIYIYLTGQSTWGVFLQSYLLLYQCYHMEWSSWTDSSHLWIHHADGFACNFHLQCPYNHCVEQEAYEDTYQFGSFGYGCFRPTHYCLACTMVSEGAQCSSKPRIILQMSHPWKSGTKLAQILEFLVLPLEKTLASNISTVFFFLWRHFGDISLGNLTKCGI